MGKKSKLGYISKFCLQCFYVNPDFVSPTFSMNIMANGESVLVAESSTILSSFTVTTNDVTAIFSNNASTFESWNSDKYVSDIHYFVNDEFYLTIAEQTYNELYPDLTCSASGSTIVTYSVQKYNSMEIPSWITFDSSLGQIKVDAPSINATTDYLFYIIS